MAPHHPGGLTRDHVVWAYRILLDRDPENEDVIGPKLAGSRNTEELRHHLMTSAEFRSRNPDFAHTNDPTIVIKEIAPGVRLFIDLSDHVIGLNILRGQYEQDEVRFVRRVVGEGDSTIDVGGHIGFFTMQMAAMVGPAGRVYAFAAAGEDRAHRRARLRAARCQRGPLRAIDRRKPVWRSRPLSSRGGRHDVGHGYAHVSFGDAQLGRCVSAAGRQRATRW